VKRKPLVLGIGGTLRAGSSSEKALRFSLRAAEAEGADVELLCGRALELPMYDPDATQRSTAALRLVELLRACDGLIIASPSYHGSISGLLKNALDYTEDLSGDPRAYLDGCAAGLISCGAGWQGSSQALAALRSIAHSLRAWPTPMGAVLNTATPLFDEGRCTDGPARFQLETVGTQVAQFARMRLAAAGRPVPALV
jgi:FMN reductase